MAIRSPRERRTISNVLSLFQWFDSSSSLSLSLSLISLPSSSYYTTSSLIRFFFYYAIFRLLLLLLHSVSIVFLFLVAILYDIMVPFFFFNSVIHNRLTVTIWFLSPPKLRSLDLFVSFFKDPRFLFFRWSSRLWLWSPFNYCNRMLWITVVLAQLVTTDSNVDRVKVAWRGWWTLASFRISFFFSFFFFSILDTSSWRINYMIYPSYLADFDWDKKIRWFEDIFRDFYLSHFRLFYCRKFLLYLMLLSLFLPIIIFLQFYLNYIIYIYIENINSNYFFSPSQFFFYKIYRINI